MGHRRDGQCRRRRNLCLPPRSLVTIRSAHPPLARRGSLSVSQDRFADALAQFSQARAQMLDQLRRVVVGQTDVIEQILAAIFTRSHCLLVGVPGLAKTLMVRTISQVLDVSFKRVQFTPDLMPSDITGSTVLDEKDGRREF